jgi:peptide deformylase
MVREIIKDQVILTKVSERATKEDLHIVEDLLNTANAYKERCAGLAAIQIGEAKRIIVAKIGDGFTTMINPFILKRSKNTYTTEEGCMSIDGTRTVKRHVAIKVGYETISGKKITTTLMGFPAQVVQHEVDHLNGVLI